jgi:hypothetical protein
MSSGEARTATCYEPLRNPSGGSDDVFADYTCPPQDLF